MNKPIVWASGVMISPVGKQPMRNVLEAEPDHPLIGKTRRRNEAGEVLAPENFPAEVWGITPFKNDKPLPDIFMGYGPWIVSKAAADVMRRFDMGQGGLFPIRVLKKDRTTPMPGEWFCLNFGNVKATLLAAESTGVSAFGSGTTDQWNALIILKDGQLAVSAEALLGPDIWVDPRIFDVFFVSDRLAAALRKADAIRGFGFRRCRVL